jgi:hypothetical protein
MLRVCLCLFAALLVTARVQGEGPRWVRMATLDLDAAHRMIVEGHPGYVDDVNAGFHLWAEQGYQEARALLPDVSSYGSAVAVVRDYLTGFEDGHTFYSDDLRLSEPIRSNGWVVDLVNGQYVVVATAPQWPIELPALGSILVQCDGRAAAAIAHDVIAPFVDRRDLLLSHRVVAYSMTFEFIEKNRFKVCQFKGADGHIAKRDVQYRLMGLVELRQWARDPAEVQAPANHFSFSGDTLWVRAASFSLQQKEVAALNVMLQQLPKQSGVRQIVFDVRGNDGGDSGVGVRIFNAATGGLVFDNVAIDKVPRTYALWRVSPESISTVDGLVRSDQRLYGSRSTSTRSLQQLLDELRNAQLGHRTWVEQLDEYRLTRSDIANRHGQLRRFQGKVVLLTDAHCASACLDFADLVRSVPGSIHIGQTTSADSLYIESGAFALPSGNHLRMSLKVWRNRIRGNNQPLTPDIPLSVDMDDDQAVYTAVLSALQ